MNNFLISADQPDWSREKCRRWWDPSRQLLKSIRNYQKLQPNSKILGYFLGSYTVMWHRFWSVITGADIPLNSHIEGGLLLPHPNGIVIHPEASIGPNCLIFQQVSCCAFKFRVNASKLRSLLCYNRTKGIRKNRQ